LDKYTAAVWLLSQLISASVTGVHTETLELLVLLFILIVVILYPCILFFELLPL